MGCKECEFLKTTDFDEVKFNICTNGNCENYNLDVDYINGCEKFKEKNN